MAELIGGFIISALTTVGVGTATATGGLLIGGITVSALTVGSIALVAGGLAYYLLARPPKPKPENVQQVLSQSIPARRSHFGEVMRGGYYAFYDSRKGHFHQIILTGHGEDAEAGQLYFGDVPVDFDAGGIITTPPWAGFVYMKAALGAGPSNFTLLEAAYPGYWTANHKLLGIAATYIDLIDPGPKKFQQVFGSGLPEVRRLGKTRKLWDPRSDVTAYSNNSGLCILDYLLNPDGWGFKQEKINIESFKYFADLCDRPFPLKGGGTQPRFRTNGSWDLIEPRIQVTRRLMDACDARLYIDRDGKIAITGGEYVAPTRRLDGSMAVSRETQLYGPPNERFNVVTPIFVSPAHNWKKIDAASLVDSLDVEKFGRRVSNVDLDFVTNHVQAQFLAKIAKGRASARVRATLVCNYAGRAVWREQRVVYADEALEVECDAEVISAGMNWSDESIGYQISIREYSRDWWEWDPETDEGPAPALQPPPTPSATIETPAGVTAVAEPIVINLITTGTRIKVTWTPPLRTNMSARIEFRRDLGGGTFDPWQAVSADADSGVAIISPVQGDGSIYQVTVQFLVTGGAGGPLSSVVTVTASGDAVAPGAVTINSATGGAGQIAVNYTLPNSANCAGAIIYRNTTNSLTGATVFGTIYGAPGQTLAVTVTGYTAGTRWVLIRAINGSGTQGATASLSAVVT